MTEELVVDDADVRRLAILQAALGAGPLFVWLVVVGLSQLPPPNESAATGAAAGPDQARLIMLLSAVHVMVALSSYAAGALLFSRVLHQRAPQDPLGRLRAATVLRLALLEGPALFGAVICLLAVQPGVAEQVPLVWLNATSTFVLLFVVVVTFPTRERVERLLREARRPAP